VLFRDSPPHYMIWGDTNLTLATSQDGLAWANVGSFMDTRSAAGGYFDTELVEAGPPPLRLTTGDYLFIYNSARQGYPSVKPDWQLQYNVGWAVLNGSDPSQILQRSEEPLLSPELPWEIGNDSASLTPNVVFVEGALAWPQPGAPDTFLFVYGAADSRVGVGSITVSATAK
jgi:predicted GH43/DUF377 family glycosyl hydrolase